MKFNSIHRQQLFHWIGRHIDAPAGKGRSSQRSQLTTAQRDAYLECLRNALTNGLWVKVPNAPDHLGDGKVIRVRLPIVCFTEWSLGESLPHAKKYGRMALGFSKQFVLSRGGQPVTYLRDARKKAPFARALIELARFLEEPALERLLARQKLAAIRQHFQFISQFAKRIQVPRRGRLTMIPAARARTGMADRASRRADG